MPRLALLLAVLLLPAVSNAAEVHFTVRSAKSGGWSDPATWDQGRIPHAGDAVQIRSGHRVTYDASSDEPIRVLHCAGTLAFSCSVSTRLTVSLLKIQPGAICSDDGFACHAPAAGANQPVASDAALEIGTPQDPLPADITATIRLAHVEGADKETLPAVINCGGRWDAHGAPMNRTWVKLGATAKPGDRRVTLAEPVTGWRAGDRIIVTASKEAGSSVTFRQSAKRPAQPNTEQRTIEKIDGATLTLDKPIDKEHWGTGLFRSEVANLSRNIIIESADPAGVRGHTMFHRGSTGGLSYAEFRHLGKEGILGKYPVHFHLLRDSMRGAHILGLAIWDSHNRFMAVHATDYLLVRDCVGYQSVGHGFFLEDGTEQYNILDRNLAVQAYRGKRLKDQALPFDPNDGAGFWWANGRNTLVRNVSCENDEYGYRFEITKASNFNPKLTIRQPDGTLAEQDVRTIPFYRFEANESHSEGLYSFNFGDDRNPSVRGDRNHPFIARDLLCWETHYGLRPNVQFFLIEGFRTHHAVYGVYHPDYDAHVYRNVHIDKATAEPINRGHDDESIQYGTFTYENLTIENSRIGRDPLIQLACTSPNPGQAGHFRNVVIKNSQSRGGSIVDLGGGPRNGKLQHPVAYYFHGHFAPGRVTRVLPTTFPDSLKDGDYRPLADFTGKGVRAADVTGVEFPTLLEPIDDLPPATLITSVRGQGAQLLVAGVTHDNGQVAGVSVGGIAASLTSASRGIAEWHAIVSRPSDGVISAAAIDSSGNQEKTPHSVTVR